MMSEVHPLTSLGRDLALQSLAFCLFMAYIDPCELELLVGLA